MKRLCLIILIAALLIPAAVYSSGVVYYDSDEAIYIGEGNNLFRPGDRDPVLTERARGIVTVVDQSVYFTISDEKTPDHDVSILCSYDLDPTGSDDIEEVGNVYGDAVWSKADGVIYYALRDEPDQLMGYSPSTDTFLTCAKADGSIIGLRLSMNGLLVKTDSGEKLYSPSLNALVEYESGAQYADITPFSDGEVLLDSKNVLSIRLKSSLSPIEIDTGVNVAIENDNSVYYLKTVDDSSQLMRYDISTGNSVTLEVFDEVMYNDMASDLYDVFFTGHSGIIYRYYIADESAEPYAYIDTSLVNEPYLAAVSNMLLIYDYTLDSDDRFIQKIDTEIYKPDEQALEEILEKANPATEHFEALSKGSRGDDVIKLQTRLKELGYLAGSADGIYASATLDAVMRLKEDLGLSGDGTADAEFLEIIYKRQVPPYKQYVDLNPGDKGSRVVLLQERLRALYYMKEAADGEYGDSTKDAVIRYQSQNGVNATGSISSKQLESLMSENADEYESYLPLQSGDRAPAVRRLAKRLKKLGYMSSSATESYNKYVVRAVKLFESYNDLRETGKASVKRQERIFSRNAKHYHPEPTPTPKPKYITEKQLKKMRNWMNNNLGTDYSKKQAIERLQNELIDLGYMGGSITREYDSATFNCVCEFQRDRGLKVTGVANVDTLISMFVYG